MKYAIILLAQGTMYAAILAIELAQGWMSIGHGLNPLIALPAATLILLMPYAVRALIED